MLKNREHPFPPGGYIFYQQQTGWFSPPGFTFSQTVDAIIDHRKKNPRFASQWSMDRATVENELDFYTCLRIKNDPNYCTQEDGSKKKSSPRPWPNFRKMFQESAAVAADRAENFSAGVGVVLDWLGDSLEPVDIGTAEARAAVCATCPQNGRPDFIQRLEGWAASGVIELMKLAKDLEVKTTKDDQLHHCQLCDCALKLKVHAKMEHILAHTSMDLMEKLPPHCWIKNQA